MSYRYFLDTGESAIKIKESSYILQIDVRSL
jgi:hypothetical protein